MYARTQVVLGLGPPSVSSRQTPPITGLPYASVTNMCAYMYVCMYVLQSPAH